MAASQNGGGHPGAASYASGDGSASLQGIQLLDSRYECIEALGQGAFGAPLAPLAAPAALAPPPGTAGFALHPLPCSTTRLRLCAAGSVVHARHVETGVPVAIKLLTRGPYFAATASNKVRGGTCVVRRPSPGLAELFFCCCQACSGGGLAGC